jgi:hypothetical protein
MAIIPEHRTTVLVLGLTAGIIIAALAAWYLSRKRD